MDGFLRGWQPTARPKSTLTDIESNSYAENFWEDKGTTSGFDLLVLKHRNGKEVCKDMAEFMRQRCVRAQGGRRAAGPSAMAVTARRGLFGS
jgi:hypothetical protein